MARRTARQIDVLQIITLFVMYYPPFSQDSDGREPHGAYAHQARCLDAFPEHVEKRSEEVDRWIQIIPSAMKLYDELQVTLPKHFPSGRFGSIKEVRIHDEHAQKRRSTKYRRKPVMSMKDLYKDELLQKAGIEV